MAVAKPEAVAAEPTIKRPCLPPGNIMPMEHMRRHFMLKAPPGMTQEDARYLEAWKHVGKQFQRHDIVYLLADDESWELEICIEAVRLNGCEVSVRKVFSRKPVNTVATILSDDFRAEWRAGMGFCVVRIHDDVPVVKGHHSEAAAILEWQRTQPKKAV
ncbi:hypothetical protein BSL82_04970 [Tardibacter chloracetimidivorans]|uniref:Uncharacterized protein n=1 Tax=Tardibacter chloracetimidivorans TaxID=1921510 RepID=A0A1L3ZSY0_9SPHN|nr:hypothetical protein [Tardibacter chloracetimidivorans]API58746.1 hypothetical protein BSL82_04970 [Tardibacter chloracetimidivorans]